MADSNQTLTNLLASLLGGLAGGIAGAVVAARIPRKGGEVQKPHPLLIPREGSGHFYVGPRSFLWVDDPCLFSLFPAASEAREVVGGYNFRFPDGENVWFRVCSLVAPSQVGRLFEVKGESAVYAVARRCDILLKSGEANVTDVRMVGATMKEYERQVDAELKGARNAVR